MKVQDNFKLMNLELLYEINNDLYSYTLQYTAYSIQPTAS